MIITSDYYIENSLDHIIQELNRQKRLSGIKNMKFFYDTARLHVTKAAKTYLNEAGFIIIHHPTYSQDKALFNYWLFDRIKSNLNDHDDLTSKKSQITKVLEDIAKEEYTQPFDKWLEWMQHCKDNKWEYFDNMTSNKYKYIHSF